MKWVQLISSLSATYSMQKEQRGKKPFDPVQSRHLEQKATNLLNGQVTLINSICQLWGEAGWGEALPFTPYLLKGASLFKMYRNHSLKNVQAISTSGISPIFFHFTSDRSWWSACSLKPLRFLLEIIAALDLGTFVFLTTATTQRSLQSLQKKPTDEYLWGTFVKIKSIQEDLSGLLRLGRVGKMNRITEPFKIISSCFKPVQIQIS